MLPISIVVIRGLNFETKAPRATSMRAILYLNLSDQMPAMDHQPTNLDSSSNDCTLY